MEVCGQVNRIFCFRLQKLAEEFYSYASPKKVAEELKLKTGLVDCVYKYWVLKRRVLIISQLSVHIFNYLHSTAAVLDLYSVASL